MQFSDLKTWREVEMKVQAEKADKAYDQVGELVGMMSDDIMGIVGYNEEQLQMDILVYARVDIPEDAPLEQIDIVHRYNIIIPQQIYKDLLQGDYGDETQEEQKIRVDNIYQQVIDITGLNKEDFLLFSGNSEIFSLIIGVKDGFHIDESGIIQKFIFEN